MQQTILVSLLATLLGYTIAQFPGLSFSPFFGSTGDASNLFAPSTTPGSSTPTFNQIGEFTFPSQFGDIFGQDGESTPPSGGLFGDQGLTGVPTLNSFFNAPTPSSTFGSLGDFAQDLQNTTPDDTIEVIGSVTFPDADCDVGTSPEFSQAFREEIGGQVGCPDGSCVDITDIECGSLVITYKITIAVPALGIAVSIENTGTIIDFIRDIVIAIAAQNTLNRFGIASAVIVEVQNVEFVDPSPPTPPSSPPPYGTKGMIMDTANEEELISTFAYLDALLADN